MTIVDWVILILSWIGFFVCFGEAIKRFPICDNAPVKYWIVPWGLMILGISILTFGVIHFFGIDVIEGIL